MNKNEKEREMNETNKLAFFAAELVNVGSKLIHKKGVFVVFNLSDEAAALSTVKFDALKLEWVGDMKANVAEVVASVKGKLDLENKDVQAKIGTWLDLAVDAAEVLVKASDFVGKVKALV